MLNLKYIEHKIKSNLRLLLSIFLISYAVTTSFSHASLDCKLKFISEQEIADIFIINKNDPIGQEYDVSNITSKISCDNVTSADIGKEFIFKYEFKKGNLIPQSALSGIGYKQADIVAGRCLFEASSLEIKCSIPKPDNSGKTEELVVHRLKIVKLDLNYDTGPLYGEHIEIKYRYEASNNMWISGLGFILGLPIYIRINSCVLDTPDINFNLGKQQQKDFTRVGPIGSGQTQKIALTCDPNTKYFLQVDGNAEPGHSGVMKLTPGAGVATGVGVQLLANSQPVEFSKAKEMGNTATSGTNIKETIDITARYYQTENRVTPGTANASATFTMTYQ
ncbi:fimbrial protein [Yersinia bercovieri]|uniref:fimbrial protein n=1 Tax=Yersinia bercovieri TaxID=634 RepID=UPI0021BD22B1|nr:fimbrial protein [Yersinia bercovieri]